MADRQVTTSIILTEEEARRVRGETTPGHRLEPRPIRDGHFILSERVLFDPAHAAHIPFLQNLPRGKIVIHVVAEGEEEAFVDPKTVFIPDNQPRIYVPPKNVWDEPPLPLEGEWNEAALYESVGRAITAWETFERSLMLLYTSILSPTIQYLPLERAYGSILGFKARLGMVRSAAEARFYRDEPVDDLEANLKSHLDLADKLSARRNDIAHGMVKPYDSPAGPISGLLVLPSDYSKGKHGLRDDINPRVAVGARFIRPKYAYGCPEILYFRNQFFALSSASNGLSNRLRRFLP